MELLQLPAESVGSGLLVVEGSTEVAERETGAVRRCGAHAVSSARRRIAEWI